MNWAGSLLLLLAFASVGCSTWSQSALPELPLPRLPPDSVVLETAFVRAGDDFDFEGLWRQIDEQQLDPAVRQRLDANGIRVGVIGTQLPEELRALLRAPRDPLTELDPLAATEPTAPIQRLQSRAGERSELIVVPQLEAGSAVLMNDAGKIRATRFEEGQALLVLRTHPGGDGTVRLDVSPEIRHGQPRQQWVPGNGMYRFDVRRNTFVFDQLGFETLLSPGQSLLVTSTQASRGLGDLLFARQDKRLILLIRLAQTQYDDLFAPERQREPFATPVE